MALKDLYSIVGSKIKEWRELHKYTQADLSIKTGINRATISNIESGKQQVSLHYLYLIANALGAEIISLLPSLKELNFQTEDILNEKFEEQNIGEVTKNTILQALNKKPENDQ